VNLGELVTFHLRCGRGKMYWSRQSVCLSVPCRIPEPDVTLGMVGVPSSCALLGRFAISARVSLLWQHSAKREISATACTHSIPGSPLFFFHHLFQRRTFGISNLGFYGPDALPVTRATVSKHRRKQKAPNSTREKSPTSFILSVSITRHLKEWAMLPLR